VAEAWARLAPMPAPRHLRANGGMGWRWLASGMSMLAARMSAPTVKGSSLR
jgi:hypothetical protein